MKAERRHASVKTILKATGALSLVATLAASFVHGQTAPLGDHHQHVFSPAITRLTPSFPPITASDVVSLLDAAGIKRAVLLSVAYMFGRPSRVIENEYEQVKAEN